MPATLQSFQHPECLNSVVKHAGHRSGAVWLNIARHAYHLGAGVCMVTRDASFPIAAKKHFSASLAFSSATNHWAIYT